MPVRRVRADDEDDVGLRDRLEILGARRRAECLLQPVARRRMADARAGIDVVVAEGGADELLNEEGFLVRAARRGDAADRIDSVPSLDALELDRRAADRLVPCRLAPRVGDLLADHRL